MAPARPRKARATTEMARVAAPEALYAHLPKYVEHEADKLMGAAAKDPSIKPGFVREFVGSATQNPRAYQERVQGRILPLSNPPTVRSTEEAAVPKASDRLRARTARQRKVYNIPKEEQKFDLYRGLHHLWTQYITGVVGSDTAPATLLPRLLKADLHGSILTVVQSKCPSYVGLSGIVVREATGMFFLVTKDDRLIGIPKANSVFSLAIGSQVLRLHGSQICCRAGERTARKFKGQNSIEM